MSCTSKTNIYTLLNMTIKHNLTVTTHKRDERSPFLFFFITMFSSSPPLSPFPPRWLRRPAYKQWCVHVRLLHYIDDNNHCGSMMLHVNRTSNRPKSQSLLCENKQFHSMQCKIMPIYFYCLTTVTSPEISVVYQRSKFACRGSVSRSIDLMVPYFAFTV